MNPACKKALQNKENLLGLGFTSRNRDFFFAQIAPAVLLAASVLGAINLTLRV